MKKAIRFLLLAAALQSIAWLGVGCTAQDPADSSIPWGRPASWEDEGPGMAF